MTTPTTASPTCAPRPPNCATAGITAHVVGLNVKTEDMAKMVCLPQTTGGRHFNAQNAEQVAGLHRRGAAAHGLRDGRRRRLAAASPTAAAIVPPPPMPASGPPALHLRALPAPNTEPLGIAVVLDRGGGSPARCACSSVPARPIPRFR